MPPPHVVRSATGLVQSLIEATDAVERGRLAVELSKTAPTTARDIAGLFDLFSRFPDMSIRRAVMDSLALMPPDSPQLEPLFLGYLRQPEPEAQLFGVNGAFHLRSQAALPLLRALAGRRFDIASLPETALLSERNAWWAQYEALSALAQWEGEKAYPLLERKVAESPEIARLLGRFYWRKALPRVKAWSRSSESAQLELARKASSAPIDPTQARETRAEMLAIARDPKADEKTRHQLALKLGAVSTEAETEELVKTHDAAPPGRERLLWAAAVFASRTQAAVPLLLRYAREAPEPQTRQGAVEQLEDMLGAERARSLLDKKN